MTNSTKYVSVVFTGGFGDPAPRPERFTKVEETKTLLKLTRDGDESGELVVVLKSCMRERGRTSSIFSGEFMTEDKFWEKMRSGWSRRMRLKG